jgi:thiamine pyrophosphokinase
MQNNNKTPIPKLINNKFLETDFDKKNDKNANLFVTIILNRPQNLETLIKLNKITDILICADGGANRLYELETTRESLIPKAIVGDLDSLSEKVKNFYEHKGTYIKKYEG